KVHNPSHSDHDFRRSEACLMPTLKPNWIIGKRVKSVEMNPFDAGSEHNHRTTYNPVIHFEDGSALAFVVHEVDDASCYGIDPVYRRKLTPTMEKCDVREATHIKIGTKYFRIASKWGILPEGRLAKPSQGGFGVVTEGGTRIDMWHAQGYA